MTCFYGNPVLGLLFLLKLLSFFYSSFIAFLKRFSVFSFISFSHSRFFRPRLSCSFPNCNGLHLICAFRSQYGPFPIVLETFSALSPFLLLLLLSLFLIPSAPLSRKRLVYHQFLALAGRVSPSPLFLLVTIRVHASATFIFVYQILLLFMLLLKSSCFWTLATLFL